MPRSSLSARDRRALTVLALVAVAAVLWATIIRPSLSRRSLLADRLNAERALLQREQSLVSAFARNDAKAGDTLAARVAQLTFDGHDDVIATASLASYVTAVATAHEVWLQAITARPATAAMADLRELRADVRAEGDIAGLLAFLDALENSAPAVRIEQLDVVRGADTDDGTAPLTISAVVVAWAAPRPRDAVIPEGDHGEWRVAASPDIVPLIEGVASRDPFAPDRQPVAVRYRLGGQRRSPVSVAGEPTTIPVASPLPEVHGTAVDGAGLGFAMVAFDGSPAVVVRQGDTIGPYTVLSIERARVLFRDAKGQRHFVDATASPDGAV